ncbi:hypothetical protein Tco_0121027 [Tanacetum coccineum]|uniref:Uncharacterized protein n=1 Tax=Tanacetum coccineum TaxID=301880 RepID=A0ABQ4WZ50_9ASTR
MRGMKDLLNNTSRMIGLLHCVEVIENGATLPKTQVVEGVTTVTPKLPLLKDKGSKLQNLVSQLELLGEKLLQEDVNLKLLRSLSLEWNTHAVV